MPPASFEATNAGSAAPVGSIADATPPAAPTDPHGTLVMVSDRDGDTSLFLLGGGRPGPERLSAASQPGAAIVELFPAWSLDGSRIAHHRLTPEGRNSLFVIDVETREAVGSVDIGPPAIAGSAPSWSPDGTRVAYWSTGDASNEIRVLDLRTGVTTNLTNDPAADRYPVWSPDGDEIAFWTDRSDKGELWVMSSDGSSPRALVEVGNAFGPAAWSPDSTSLAVAVQRGPDEFALIVADRGGTLLAELPTTVSTVSPAWSANGEMIVYWDLMGPVRELILSDLSGAGVRRLGPLGQALADFRLASHSSTPWPAAPAWSPHGDQLAVEWPRPDGTSGLLVVAVESNEWRFLTDSAAAESSATWQPDQP
jgi:TolB protein